VARIIVAGYIVRFPLAGQAWAHLHYLLGLRALGHEVFFYEDAGWPDACYDAGHGVMSDDPGYGLRMLAEWFTSLGLTEHWFFRDIDHTGYGLSAQDAQASLARADILVNLSGVTWFEGFERIPLRIFIDEDPAFTQVRAASEPDFAALLKLHHALFTYGQHVGQPGCDIPTAGLDWRPLQQPIFLDAWPVQTDTPETPFTTILSWNAYGEVSFEDRLYGSKSRSFPMVLALPERTNQALELAVSGDGISPAELTAHGWCVRDPLAVSRTLDTYRRYIQRSRGEFSVAKHGYIASHSGWFSDRSAAYLASGRPVVLQDTGYSTWLPTGFGLLAYSDLDEAVEALDRINADYEHHSRAARAIAEEYFDARRVLEDLLRQL
jgi:hypothetical protein